MGKIDDGIKIVKPVGFASNQRIFHIIASFIFFQKICLKDAVFAYFF